MVRKGRLLLMSRPKLTDSRPDLEDRIVALYQTGRFGKKSLAYEVGVSSTTVMNILRKHGIDISGNANVAGKAGIAVGSRRRTRAKQHKESAKPATPTKPATLPAATLVELEDF